MCVFKRVKHTLQLILTEIGQTVVPVVKTWRSNERHYGDLTSLNKNKAVILQTFKTTKEKSK